jgi:hypothetical protein
VAKFSAPRRFCNSFVWDHNAYTTKAVIAGTTLTVLASEILDEPSLVYGISKLYIPEYPAFIDGCEYSEVLDGPAGIDRLPHRNRQAQVLDFFQNLGNVLRKPESFSHRDVEFKLDDLDEEWSARTSQSVGSLTSLA